MKRNVYDFDHTIYNGDSSIDFYFFLLKKNLRVTCTLPSNILYFFLYKFKIITKKRWKEKYFSFIKKRDIEEDVKKFWVTHQHKIMKWYLDQLQNTDIIISASPEFLLKPITDELSIHLISSVINPKTAKFIGENCYGKEKVNRLKKEFPNIIIENFYTDSLSDQPLLDCAENQHIIKN